MSNIIREILVDPFFWAFLTAITYIQYKRTKA